jgi:hypothetical protein
MIWSPKAARTAGVKWHGKTPVPSEFDPEIEREKILSGKYNLKISVQKQRRHIKNTKEYEQRAAEMAKTGDKPSRLRGNLPFAQNLVHKYAGKGIITPNRRGGSLPEETVKTRQIVGKYWAWKTRHWSKTRWLRIKYSKTGTHVIPVHGRKS